jgi:hypothetical protein
MEVCSMNRAELRKLARDRIKDAKILFKERRWGAAYYLAGYGIECALKACIAKLMKPEEFSDRGFAEKCWTHDLNRLVFLAGLEDQQTADSQADPEFKDNWGVVETWNESSRYKRKTRGEARMLLAAITEERHGVWQWVRKHW